MRRLRAINPTVALVALGVFSAAFYAAIVYLFPLIVYAVATRPYDMEQLSRGGREWAAIFYAVGLLLVFGAFALAMPLVKRARHGLAWTIGFGVLFALILYWLYPITAIDVFYYVLQGRQEVIYNLNPLIQPASLVPTDPLVPFVGEWSTFPSPYGPIWGVLSAAVVRLGFSGTVNGPLAFKAIAVVLFIISIFVLAWGANRKAEAVMLFAWNPMILLEGPAHAHNDLMMITLAVLALVVWEKKRWWAPAVILLALGVAIKIPVVLLGPLLFVAVLRAQPTWSRRIWIGLAMIVLGAAVTLLSYLPYWPPWETVAGLAKMYSSQRTYTIVATIWLGLSKIHVGPPYSTDYPRLAGTAILAVSYLMILWQLWVGKLKLYEAGFWALFIYILTAASYRIWYPVWVVPLAALAIAAFGEGLLAVRMRWRAYLLSMTSELSVLMFTLLWRWVLNGVYFPKADWFLMHILTVPWQYGLPLLVPLLIRRRPAAEAPVVASEAVSG